MYKIIIAILFVVSSFVLFSQETTSISGTIINRSTNVVVENAEVVLTGSNEVSTTGPSGKFKFRSIPAGSYQLEIHHVAFENYSLPIKLTLGQELTLEIALNPSVKPLEEVVIEDSRLQDQIISRLPYVETQFTKQQIDQEGARDVTDYLRSSKNINGIRKGGTQLDPVVRGFKYSQLNVQLNGGQKIEGGCPNRMDPATAHVEIEDIESIEVVKGPYALKYGPMFGAMINMNTEIPPHTDSSYIHLKALMAYESNWNGNKQHLNLYGGYKWFFYRLSGGKKDYNNYSDGNGNEVKSGFRKYNFNGQLGFIPALGHQVSFKFEESKGRDVLFPTLPMDERKDDTRLLSLNYKAVNLAKNWSSLKFLAYNTDVQHEMDNKNRSFSDTVVAVSVIDAIARGFRLETGFNLLDGKLIAGVDLENTFKDGTRDKYMILQPGLPVKEEKLWNNAEILNTGVFVEYNRNYKSWEFLLAGRFDFNQARSDDIVVNHPAFGEIYHYGSDSTQSFLTNISISGAVTKVLSDHWSLSLALGRGVRSPDMTERFIIMLPIGYDNYDYLGDPLLNPEANNQLDLTAKYQNHKLGNIQINGFYSLINNYITGRRLAPVDQKPLSKGVLGVKQFYNGGNAKMRGFELAYGSPVHNKFELNLFSSYTYGTIDKVEKYVTNEDGQVIDTQEIENDAMTEIPPFETTMTLGYKMIENRFLVKCDLRWVSAQNHVSEASYEVSSESFFLTGLSMSYRFKELLYLSAGVNNLFDTAYYEHLNRNIIGSTRNLYEPGRSFYVNLSFSI